MRHRVSRRLAILLATASFTLGIPLGVVIAGASFNDVPSTNPFYDDIVALANSGVTTGCGGGNFCPKDVVTREQMAAFMNRLGALQAGKKPVVNADKVDGLNAGDLVRAATANAGSTGSPCASPIFGDFSASTFTSAVSRQVTAPGSGVLLVWGNVSAERVTGATGELRLEARLAMGGTQIGVQAENSYDDQATVTCQEARTMSLSTAVPVSAGDYTVSVDIKRAGGTATAWVGDASVTTLFVPFSDANGLTTASTLSSYGDGGATNR